MDELVRVSVVQLNMIRAKLLARIAMLEGVYDNKEHIRRDLERFERGKDHLVAAISYIEGTHHAPDFVELELPF